MSGGNSGVVRAGIPASFRKTIQDIKEITGNHSDEDIYAMLKECNMDPNETAQKLFYLDTFHEVKKKRDNRKSNVSNQSSEQNRFTSGMQRQGLRGGRGNNSAGYFSNDNGGGKKRSPPVENGNTGREAIHAGIARPFHQNTRSGAGVSDTSPSNDAGRPTRPITSSPILESVPHNSEGTFVKSDGGTSAAGVNKWAKRPTLPSGAAKQLQSLNHVHTIAPKPTTAFTDAFGAASEGRNSDSASSNISITVPVSGVYSCASDPVLLPALNPRMPGTAGTIKRETGTQIVVPELSNSSLPENRSNVCGDGISDSQVVPKTIYPNSKTLQGVQKDQDSEPSRPSSLMNSNIAAVAAQQDVWSTKQANGSSNVITHMGATVPQQANMTSLPTGDDSVLGQATSQLSWKLEGLNITSQGPVIFPRHIQVPDVYRNGLTFGSLDGSLGQVDGVREDDKLVDRTTLANEDDTRDPSLSLEIASATARNVEYPGQPQSFPPMPENLLVLEANVLPSAPPMYKLSKSDIMAPIGGAPYPFLHTTPDYGFGILPPMLAPHLMPVEGTEFSSSSVSSTSVSSQPLTQTTVGVGQNSPAVSPPLFPYLRQPYASNYFPYNPYFTQLYMPTNAPQIFGHNGFAQQASTGNIYMPPSAAGTGVKFPLPQLYKPGTVPANLTHFGIPSGYGSYDASTLGYGVGATMPPPGSSSIEDISAPELKEQNIYPVLKQSQNEESHVWTSAPAQDIQSLQTNYSYNYPHTGQGSLAGMYHLTPPTATTPSIAQTPPQQSRVLIGSVDPVVSPVGTYQQPHSRLVGTPNY